MAPPTRLLILKVLSSSLKLNPTAMSVSLLRTPNVSRSQSGVVAAIQALMTDKDPKTLIVPHTRPAAPLFPKTKASAVVEPINAVRAATSMSPPPKLEDDEGGLVVEFAIGSVAFVRPQR